MSFPKTNLNIYGKKYYNFIASVLHKSGSFSASNSHALVPFLFYGKKCTHRRSAAHHPSSPLSPCSPSAFLSLLLLPQGRTRPTDGASFPACARRSPGRRCPKCPWGRKKGVVGVVAGEEGGESALLRKGKKFRERRKRDEKRSSYSCSFDCCSSCCTRGKVRPGNSCQNLKYRRWRKPVKGNKDAAKTLLT